jgi:hypothetical protein
MEKIIQEEVEKFLTERGIQGKQQDFNQLSMDNFIEDLLKIASKEEVNDLFTRIQKRVNAN